MGSDVANSKRLPLLMLLLTESTPVSRLVSSRSRHPISDLRGTSSMGPICRSDFYPLDAFKNNRFVFLQTAFLVLKAAPTVAGVVSSKSRGWIGLPREEALYRASQKRSGQNNDSQPHKD